MKKERNKVVVVLCMILLLVPIILPPVFRKFIPKEEVNSQIENKSKIELLKCRRVFLEELYEVNSSTRYMDGKISTNKIIYNKLITPPEDYVEKEMINHTTVAEEFAYFSSLNNINIETNEKATTVILNKDSIRNNTTDANLTLYLQEDIVNQKSFYENMGYTCNILES